MNIVKAAVTVGSFTLVSRVLGFVRDLMMAATLGASAMGRALLVALHRRLAHLGVHLAIASIALPNPASVAIAEVAGYRPVGDDTVRGSFEERWGVRLDAEPARPPDPGDSAHQPSFLRR